MTSVREIIEASGIGASEIAAIAGISPYADPWTVYARKHGMIEDEQTEEQFWGIELEPVIASVFSRRMGLPIERCNRRIYNRERRWQYASPDAFILTEPRELLEVKTSSLRHAGEWDREIQNEDGIPDYYWAQVEWQLSTLGLETAYVAVLIAGNDFRTYRMKHDPELEEILLEVGEKFWREHLMSHVEPPISGAKAARDYLKYRFPRERDKLRPATVEEIVWLGEYAGVRSQLDGLEERKDSLENQIKQAIGDAEGITWANGKFTWKKTKDRKEVDWEDMARTWVLKGLTSEEQKAMTKRYTLPKPGTRRIDFRTWEAA